MPPERRQARHRGLLPGDSLEYGITAEIKDGGRSLWIKFGGTTTVNPGETPEAAVSRLSSFIEEQLDQKVNEYVGG